MHMEHCILFVYASFSSGSVRQCCTASSVFLGFPTEQNLIFKLFVVLSFDLQPSAMYSKNHAWEGCMYLVQSLNPLLTGSIFNTKMLKPFEVNLLAVMIVGTHPCIIMVWSSCEFACSFRNDRQRKETNLSYFLLWGSISQQGVDLYVRSLPYMRQRYDLSMRLILQSKHYARHPCAAVGRIISAVSLLVIF